MAVGSALPTVISRLILNLEVVDLVKRYLHTDEVRLSGGVGVVTDPAGKTSLTVSDHVQVVEVPSFVSESRVCVSELSVYQATCVAPKAQCVRGRVIGNVFFPIEPFYCKGSIPLVNGVTVGATSLCGRLMQVSGIFNVSSNISVTFQAITSRA